MPQSRYFIVQQNDDWVIKFQDEEFGPYQSKSEAMLFAVDAAQKLGKKGENSEGVPVKVPVVEASVTLQ